MTTRGITRVSLTLAAGALAACVGAARPPLELYRLRPPGAADSASLPSTAGGGTPPETWLVIEPYGAPGLYGEPPIVYRIGEITYGAYPNREWALPLSTMLAALTVDAVRRSGTFADRVTDDATVLRPEMLIWRGKIDEFEEVNRGDRVSAAVRLDAMLVRAGDDSVLWQGRARLEQPVDEPTMPAVVGALSTLAVDVITRLAREADSAARPYTARRPPTSSRR